MKAKYLFNNFIIIIIICINLVNSKQCRLYQYSFIGYKIFCESKFGETTSCNGAPYPVQRAYIQCAQNYHNDENILQLVIDCQNNGKWSHKIIKCRPECDNTNLSFDLIKNPKKEYPAWYAEVVELTSNKTIKNTYPGIILSERRVLIKKQYLKDDLDQNVFRNNFVIRIPRLKYYRPREYMVSHYIDNDLYFPISTEFEAKEKISNTTIIIIVSDNSYIKYDDVTLPACDEVYSEKNKGSLKLLHYNENRFKYFGFYEDQLPRQEKRCLVPNIIKKQGTEIACYSCLSFDLTTRKPVECINRADFIILRCQIGYEQKFCPQRDYLDYCVSMNAWTYGTIEKNDNCNLICGEVDKNYYPKHMALIYKGEKTHNGFAPWHVAIYFKKNRMIEQLCGGTIIHSNIILSAGHCFYDVGFGKFRNASNYIIGAGKYYRQYETQEESEQYANVKSIHIPNNYEALPMRNDIAILVLDHYLRYTWNIKPICIDFSSDSIPGGLEGYIVGWGAKSEDNDLSNELQIANLTTLTNTECKIEVGATSKSEITSDKFCAINKIMSSACQGDSGGGYVVKKTIDGKERYFLLGIISSGVNTEKYCSEGFVTVFTNVVIYKDFIKNIISSERTSHVIEE